MKKNPFHITYDDLIKQQESHLRFMEKAYPQKKLEGSISAFTANKNIAAVKTLIGMLKKHRRDPQLNLNDLFENCK